MVSPANIIAIAPARLSGRHQVGGDDRADAEERAVAQRGDDAAGHHRPRSVGASAESRLPAMNSTISADQHALAGEPGDGGGEADGAHGDAEGVAGDEPARGGLGDAEVGGHLGQQAHDDELGEADAEAPDGQGESPRGMRESSSRTLE